MSNQAETSGNPKSETERYFRALLPEMIDFTKDLVEVESFTKDIASLDRCAYKLADHIFARLGIRPQFMRVGEEERPHLRVDLGTRPDVVLIGHFDTVHPLGSLELNPARYVDGRLYGPGALDMKGGCVMMIEIARRLQQTMKSPNISLFFNSDEELGSFTSDVLLCDMAQHARGAMVFDFGDPSRALRNAARGVHHILVKVKGKGGHAAYPERVHNPVEMVAKIIASLDKIRDGANGLSVTPTIVEGSESTNVVRDVALLGIDIRGRYDEQFERVKEFLRTFGTADFQVEVETLLWRPAFPPNAHNAVLAAAQVAAENLGWAPLHCMEARGASDANTIASVCDSIVDGLGGWGEGAHSDTREFLDVESLVHFATLGAATSELILAEAAASEREAS